MLLTYLTIGNIYVKQLLESMGLTVKTPIIVKVDNKGTVDLANGWSTDGSLKYVEVRQFCIRNLREERVLRVDWIPGTENKSDILTKNTTGQVSGVSEACQSFGGVKGNKQERVLKCVCVFPVILCVCFQCVGT